MLFILCHYSKVQFNVMITTMSGPHLKCDHYDDDSTKIIIMMQRRTYIRWDNHHWFAGLPITWTPLHLVFFKPTCILGTCSFHHLWTFCRGELLKLVWISVAKIWSRSLILLFPQENRTFGFSGIHLCHRSRIEHFAVQKTLQGVNYV
jgi:hypothetical protein